MTNNKNNYCFIRQISNRFVTALSDGKTASVSIPGNVRFRVGTDCIFEAADQNGNPVPNHVNVRLDKGAEYEVTVAGDDGNVKRETRTAQQLINAWASSQREYGDAMGGKTWITGISPKLVRESKVPMQDGRVMLSVSVADPESVPAEGKKTGYGSFLVSPDAVTPCKSGDKLNVYLGRANAKISSYQIRTGESTFEKIARTAAEIKANFEADIAAFKASMATA